MVKSTQLDELIKSGLIEKFKRSDGWVSVEVGPLRGSKEIPYKGPERRSVERIKV
jgi:hypothetical protein